VSSLKFYLKLTEITLSTNTYSHFCEHLERNLLQVRIYRSGKKSRMKVTEEE
jgi:hypothetical protein